ncbi:MAG: thioredoxin [Patescibacteria group bacterium]
MDLKEITDQTFDKEVLQAERLVLVDFWATWCGPCRLAAPVLEELSKTYKDKVLFVKLDVDKNPNSPQKYGVMSIPTTILFKDGKEIGRQVGFAGKQKFVDILDRA